MGGGGQAGEAEALLATGESGWRVDEGRVVAEGAEAALLGQELLVGHGVDGVREGKRRAAEEKRHIDGLYKELSQQQFRNFLSVS